MDVHMDVHVDVGRPFGRPYGRPRGRPYGRPFGRPYGRPYGRPFGRPYGRPHGRPYGRPNQPVDPVDFGIAPVESTRKAESTGLKMRSGLFGSLETEVRSKDEVVFCTFWTSKIRDSWS